MAANNSDTVLSLTELLKKQAEDDANSDAAILDLNSKQEITSDVAKPASSLSPPPPVFNTVNGKLFAKVQPPRAFSLKIAVVIFFCISAVIIGLAVHYDSTTTTSHELQVGDHATRLFVDQKTRRLRLVRSGSRTEVLVGNLAVSVPAHVLPTTCGIPVNDSELCLVWSDHLHLVIREDGDGTAAQCFTIQWDSDDAKSEEEESQPSDCYELSGAHWYGGWSSAWPVDNMTMVRQPYIISQVEPALERYWLTSDGVAIFAARDFALDASLNAHNASDGALCLYASGSHLRYTICVADDVRRVHDYVTRHHFDARSGNIADKRPVEDPVWSTHFDASLNATTTTMRSYGISHLIVDPGCHNDYVDFSDVANRTFAELNASVLLGVRPYVEITAPSFASFARRGFLLGSERAPVIKRCDDLYVGPWALHDAAISEIRKHLTAVRDRLNITSFAFLQSNRELLSTNTQQYLNSYCALAKTFGETTFVAHGCPGNNASSWLLVADAASSWDELQAVIPRVLALGIMGYPFVVPGIVGGQDRRPARELYIRWFQLAAFLPAVHLSVLPDLYGTDMVDMARSILALRARIVVPRLLSPMNSAANHSMNSAANHPTPLITPVWWAFPNDSVALQINSQFFVGKDLLAAPILTRGRTARDIYLPEGRWRDGLTTNIISGPVWMKNYVIKLHQVAYFLLL